MLARLHSGHGLDCLNWLVDVMIYHHRSHKSTGKNDEEGMKQKAIQYTHQVIRQLVPGTQYYHQQWEWV